MKQSIKQSILNVMMAVVFVTIFAWLPLSNVDAQTTTKPATSTTSSSDRVQDGLDSISDAFPETIVDKEATPEGLAKRVIDIALYVSAIVAVIFVIYGGYQYIYAGGNDETSKAGRKTLVNALIGLAIIVLSYIIVQVVYRFLTDQS